MDPLPTLPMTHFNPKCIKIPSSMNKPKNTWAFFWSPIVNQMIYGKILEFDRVSSTSYMIHYVRSNPELENVFSPRSLQDALYILPFFLTSILNMSFGLLLTTFYR